MEPGASPERRNGSQIASTRDPPAPVDRVPLTRRTSVVGTISESPVMSWKPSSRRSRSAPRGGCPAGRSAGRRALQSSTSSVYPGSRFQPPLWCSSPTLARFAASGATCWSRWSRRRTRFSPSTWWLSEALRREGDGVGGDRERPEPGVLEVHPAGEVRIVAEVEVRRVRLQQADGVAASQERPGRTGDGVVEEEEPDPNRRASNIAVVADLEQGPVDRAHRRHPRARREHGDPVRGVHLEARAGAVAGGRAGGLEAHDRAIDLAGDGVLGRSVVAHGERAAGCGPDLDGPAAHGGEVDLAAEAEVDGPVQLTARAGRGAEEREGRRGRRLR